MPTLKLEQAVDGREVMELIKPFSFGVGPWSSASYLITSKPLSLSRPHRCDVGANYRIESSLRCQLFNLVRKNEKGGQVRRETRGSIKLCIMCEFETRDSLQALKGEQRRQKERETNENRSNSLTLKGIKRYQQRVQVGNQQQLLLHCKSFFPKTSFVSIYVTKAFVFAIFDDAKISLLLRVRAAAADLLARNS